MTQKIYSGERTGGEEIVLGGRWERLIFLGGLGACMLLLVISEFVWP